MQDADSPLPFTLNNLANTCLILRCVHNFLPSLESGLFTPQCVFSQWYYSTTVAKYIGTVKSARSS